MRTHFPLAKLEHSPDKLGCVITIVAGLIDDSSTDCDWPLDLHGTPYEVKVWLMLREIPVGRTTTYRALGERMMRLAMVVHSLRSNRSFCIK